VEGGIFTTATGAGAFAGTSGASKGDVSIGDLRAEGRPLDWAVLGTAVVRMIASSYWQFSVIFFIQWPGSSQAIGIGKPRS